jgi:tetratricopeptide (TPR) repeat protein
VWSSPAVRWASLTLLASLVLAVFFPVLNAQFVLWDDPINVTENPLLNPVSWPRAIGFWVQSYAGLYIPVTYSFWALEAWISQSVAGPDSLGLSPRVFHAGNLLLHLVNVWLVRSLLLRWTESEWAAWFGAALFAIHPLQVESVAWVTETKGLLATTLGLWAWNVHERGFATGTRGLATRGWNVAATLLYGLSLLAKPSLVVLPLMVGWVDVAWSRRSTRTVASTLSVWCLLALAIVIGTNRLQSRATEDSPIAWAQRPLVALDALGHYAQKLLMPIHLGPDYGRRPQQVIGDGAPWLGLVCLALLLGAAWWACGRKSAAIGAGLLLLGLAPVLGLVPFDYQRFSTVADRYMYLAMLGPAWWFASWIAIGFQSIRVVPAAGMLAVWGVLSAMQTTHWHDSYTLFEHALTVNPNCFMAHNGLGNLAAEQGDFGKAEDHYREALRIEPASVAAHFNLANVYLRQGLIEAAEKKLIQAIELDPNYWKAHLRLAQLLDQRGPSERAALHWEAVAILRPEFPEAHLRWIQALREAGRTEDAINACRHAVNRLGKWPEGENLLAWLLATSHDAKLRDPAEAIRLAEAACHSTPEPRASWLDTLAAAYASAGRWSDAVSTAESALQVAELAGPTELTEGIRQRLAGYRAEQAYIER